MLQSVKYAVWCCVLMFMSACYSNYVSLDYDIHHYPCRNEAGDQLAFVISKCAYRPAKGIARFPDGGSPKYLLEETTLYVLDTLSGQLKKIADFSDLSQLLGCHRSSWSTRVTFCDSIVCCMVSPVSDWTFYFKMATTARDSQQIAHLQDKYYLPLAFSIKTESPIQISDSVFNTAYNKEEEVSFSVLKRHLSKVPLTKLGLNIKEIYPKSEKAYIQEAIFLKNPSPLSRQAILEQIISTCSKNEINQLLRKMDAYENRLQGAEKERYKRKSKALYNKMQALL